MPAWWSFCLRVCLCVCVRAGACNGETRCFPAGRKAGPPHSVAAPFRGRPPGQMGGHLTLATGRWHLGQTIHPWLSWPPSARSVQCRYVTPSVMRSVYTAYHHVTPLAAHPSTNSEAIWYSSNSSMCSALPVRCMLALASVVCVQATMCGTEWGRLLGPSFVVVAFI